MKVEVDVAELVVVVDEVGDDVEFVWLANVPDTDTEIEVVMVDDIPESEVEAVLAAEVTIVALDKRVL